MLYLTHQNENQNHFDKKWFLLTAEGAKPGSVRAQGALGKLLDSASA
ncbi:hypothetical protein PAE9249_00162 [Paenibacillus sp. CECT 9249]|nr:hypothetical protein PAE9249_00162 [Paenibacillus sp. CECT 9249]